MVLPRCSRRGANGGAGPAALLLLLLALFCRASACPSRVRLSGIHRLVFRQGESSTSRVGNVLPRLIEAEVRWAHPEVSQIVCERDYSAEGALITPSPVWNCSTADLGSRYVLASASVSCEGWDGPGDDYVVAGSCVIEYSVELNQKFAFARLGNELEFEGLYRNRRWRKRELDNLYAGLAGLPGHPPGE